MTVGNNTVTKTQYASEVVALYDRRQSFFRGTVLTKGNVNGESFVFTIGPVAEMAVERGADGDIPVLADNQSSVTVTLKEYHAKHRKNGFHMAVSAVNQRTVMQENNVASMNKRTDQLVITQLDTTAYNTGAAAAGNAVGFWLEPRMILGNNDVPVDDGKLWGAISPAANEQMMRVAQATSKDYIDDRPFMKQRRIREWLGIKFFVHTGIPGKGTSSATCFIYHEDAVGHALHVPEGQTAFGYDEEEDRTFSRVSNYQAAKMLQDEGVVETAHDDTAALV